MLELKQFLDDNKIPYNQHGLDTEIISIWIADHVRVTKSFNKSYDLEVFNMNGKFAKNLYYKKPEMILEYFKPFKKDDLMDGK